jgi:hypothetical protein
MRRDRMPPDYTTEWNELPVAWQGEPPDSRCWRRAAYDTNPKFNFLESSRSKALIASAIHQFQKLWKRYSETS